MRNLRLALILFGLGVATAIATHAQDTRAVKSSKPDCFLSHDWSGWKATPDSKAMYIRVGGNRLYRLDMAQACPSLNGIGMYLVTRTRGSSWICHPLDLDLKVSDGHGFKTACIVSGITRLSPEAAKALPRNQQP